MESSHTSYLIANEEDVLWGLTVNSVGFQRIQPNGVYPPQNHPSRYLFTPQKGRCLDEYQLLYLTKGNGYFKSSSHNLTELTEGQIFLLFPGEWHSYYPNKNTGWNEYWIGFNGTSIENKVLTNMISVKQPIFNVGLHEDIIMLYKDAIAIAKLQRSGFQQLLAGIVEQLLGLAYSLNKTTKFESLKSSEQIIRARILIIERFHLKITPEEIAKEVNLGYSYFRRLFKKYTGFAPAQYILELRIIKGKELLTNTDENSQEIAYAVGFESPVSFCKIFKQRTGYTPLAYRQATRN